MVSSNVTDTGNNNPAFDHAETLARFVALEPSAAPAFQARFPNFIPMVWWNFKMHREERSEMDLDFFWTLKRKSKGGPLNESAVLSEAEKQSLGLTGLKPELNAFAKSWLRRLAGSTSGFGSEEDGQQYQDFAVELREIYPPPTAVPLWQFFQAELRNAWQEGRPPFPIETSVKLIAGGFSNIISFPSLFNTEFLGMEAFLGTYNQTHPYQLAVMFLSASPWRAGICNLETCKKRFIKDKPATRYCSTACSNEAQRISGSAWWERNGNQWRAKSKKRKAKEK